MVAGRVFLSEAAVSGGPIRLLGLSETSLQGDKACVHLWRQFGLSVTEENGVYVAENKNTDKPYRGLHGIAINAAQIPDMVPALAVTAAFAEGETVISHAERLHLKECDRLLAMEAALKNLGADIKAVPDGLIIHGKPRAYGWQSRGHERPPRRHGARCRRLCVHSHRHGRGKHQKSSPRIFPGS